MAEHPYMPLWTDAYFADTKDLSCLQHGAYLQLLMLAWRAGGSLPNDEHRLARMVGLTIAQWRRNRDAIMGFFTLNEDGRLVQRRLTREFARVRQVCESRAANGRASALKRKGQLPAKRNASEGEASTSISTTTVIPLLREEKETAKAVPKRNTRLPEGWVLPDDWAQWAKQELRWNEAQVRGEALKFADYWHATGKTKADWKATWRGWCRRAAESGGPKAQPNPKNWTSMMSGL